MVKRKKLAATVLFISGSCMWLSVRIASAAGADSFPDPIFYRYVSRYDTDGNGELSVQERETVTVLNVSGMEITSLAGVEQFPNLTELYCYDNKLTELKVNANTKLQILDCTNNQIEKLELASNEKLNRLYCRDNQLSTITVAAASAQLVMEYDAGVMVITGNAGPGVGENQEESSSSGDQESQTNGSDENDSSFHDNKSQSGSEAQSNNGEIMLIDERPDSQMVYEQVSQACEIHNHTAYLPGYADGTFRPDAEVTRADLAAVLYGILNDAEKERLKQMVSSLPDVAPDAWYAEAVCTMRAAGIMRVEADKNFYPAKLVTRAELAEILDRYAAGTGAGIDFADLAGHRSAACIRRVANKGWLQADQNGMFYPERAVTRAEVAVSLNRMLGRNAQECMAIRPQMSYTDVGTDHWAYADIMEASVSHTPKKD